MNRNDDMVTASEIAAWARCPESWRLEAVGHKPGNRAALKRGETSHARTASFETGSREGSATQPDSLDEVPRDAAAVPLIEVRGPHVRMPEERLDLVVRHALVIEVGGDRHAEAVRRDPHPDPRPLGVPSHHLVDVIARHRGP